MRAARRSETLRCATQLGPIRYASCDYDIGAERDETNMLTEKRAGNLQLMDTVERYYCTLPTTASPSAHTPSDLSSSRKLWGEIPRGLYLIRGENVAYLGEIDLDLEDDPPVGWEKVEAEEIHRLDKGLREQREKELKSRNKSLREKGLEREMGEEVIFV